MFNFHPPIDLETRSISDQTADLTSCAKLKSGWSGGSRENSSKPTSLPGAEIGRRTRTSLECTIARVGVKLLPARPLVVDLHAHARVEFDTIVCFCRDGLRYCLVNGQAISSRVQGARRRVDRENL